MVKFYVLRCRKALWNLFILVLVVAAFVYIFRVVGGLTTDGEQEGEPPTTEQVVVVEPVTVRTVPTKFAEYKLERERMRSRQVEFLQNIAYDPHAQSETKEEAQKDLQALIDRITRETEIENLLKAKGYLDALCLLDQGSITVVVPVTLTREEAARIGELVNRLTGIRLEAITIVDETIGV